MLYICRVYFISSVNEKLAKIHQRALRDQIYRSTFLSRNNKFGAKNGKQSITEWFLLHLKSIRGWVSLETLNEINSVEEHLLTGVILTSRNVAFLRYKSIDKTRNREWLQKEFSVKDCNSKIWKWKIFLIYRSISTSIYYPAEYHDEKSGWDVIFPTTTENGIDNGGKYDGAVGKRRADWFFAVGQLICDRERQRRLDDHRLGAADRSTIANWKNTPIRLQFFLRDARSPRYQKNFKSRLAYDGKYIRRGGAGERAEGSGCETNIERCNRFWKLSRAQFKSDIFPVFVPFTKKIGTRRARVAVSGNIFYRWFRNRSRRQQRFD